MRILAAFLIASPLVGTAQLDPAITAWVINPGNETGYNNIPSNVMEVAYNATDVYVGCTGIPGYNIGPWPGNPNTAGDQDWEFKITLAPQQNSGAPVNTPLGHIGVWVNGVTIFNPRDGMSYNMQNIWRQNAFYFEGSSFDNCLGHPNQQSEYHTHINPTCLYDDSDSTVHAPILGYAFDGFPIYGAYGHANTNGTGGITRMRSSYRTRAISDRTTLPDGSVLNANQYGPAINANFPLGAYLEDFEYVPGLGDLDDHNGRFCVTPEYPNGIYAYFVTLDADLQPAYPYVLGPTYYGTVQAGNTGPGSGHNTVPSGVLIYNPFSAVAEPTAGGVVLWPNPTSDQFHLAGVQAGTSLRMLDAGGKEALSLTVGAAATVGLGHLAPGAYTMLLNGAAHRVVVMR